MYSSGRRAVWLMELRIVRVVFEMRRRALHGGILISSEAELRERGHTARAAHRREGSARRMGPRCRV